MFSINLYTVFVCIHVFPSHISRSESSDKPCPGKEKSEIIDIYRGVSRYFIMLKHT